MRVRKMLVATGLAAILALAGCAGAPDEDAATGPVPVTVAGSILVLRSEPMIALARDDIPSILREIAALDRTGAPVTDLSHVELVARTEEGRRWAATGGHRALALGTPAHCPFIAGSRKGASAGEAVESALGRCLDGVARIAADRGQDCGCQIAAVDDALLLEPAALRWRELLATVVVLRRGEGERRQVAPAFTDREEEWRETVDRCGPDIRPAGYERAGDLDVTLHDGPHQGALALHGFLGVRVGALGQEGLHRSK